ncbi:MAG TPA: hypothetical protein DCZ95_04905 [Verrucomicrobia bacterium]|nr:MAG: hypothetical protein A2X46_08455 [Lentisphaerae bacterium GWF2_57_35]HBA83416.1 hypothetical protein [Verrucomicrobiota bacterium]
MKAKRTLTYHPDYAIPPGETLREVMESLGMTQQELAIRVGLTVQSLNRICNGSQPISYETASALELATGIPARFWNNLETRYQERLVALEKSASLAKDLEMKKVPWNGATRWLTPEKAMVLLNLRGKGEDRFWFSFFHEIGHVLHDSKKDLLINDGSKDDPREARANAFAAETLIPSEYNDRIAAIGTPEELNRLAQELDIAPGIVAGRYQHLSSNWARFKSLIRTLKWNITE